MAIAFATTLSSCGDQARLPEEAVMGATPTLAEPVHSSPTTVNIASAKGWPPALRPKPHPD
jgi:hypothetical protein